jgi:hypothetical protein
MEPRPVPTPWRRVVAAVLVAITTWVGLLYV